MYSNRTISDKDYYDDPNPSKKAIKIYHNYGEGFWDDQKSSKYLVSRLFDKKEEAEHYLNIIRAVEDERNHAGFSIVSSVKTPGKFRVFANLNKINTTLSKATITPIQNWIVNYLNQFALPSKIYEQFLKNNENAHIRTCAKDKWHISPYGKIVCGSVTAYFEIEGIFDDVQDFFKKTMENLFQSKEKILDQNKDATFIFFKDNSVMYARALSAIHRVTASALQTGEHAKKLTPDLLAKIAFFVPSKDVNNIRLVNQAAAKTYDEEIVKIGFHKK
jgi:hypothetical protein